MRKENLVVTPENVEIKDGKVVISSEELAAAIQEHEVDLDAPEEMGFEINIGCVISKNP